MERTNEENAGIFCICNIALVKYMLALMGIWIIITLIHCKAKRPQGGEINKHKIENMAMLLMVYDSWLYVWINYLEFMCLLGTDDFWMSTDYL